MYSTAFQYLSICIGNPIGYQGSCLNLTMVLEATVLGVGLPISPSVGWASLLN
jgi:hypothetical protein